MILRFLILFLSVTSTQAAVSSQVGAASKASLKAYTSALEEPKAKKSCETFKKLSSTKTFPLQNLALLRHAEHCQNEPNWSQLEKNFKDPILHQFFVKAWFEDLVEKGRYNWAWRLYSSNRNVLSLDKKDFEDLALPALKQKLSKKERRQLNRELRKKSPRFIKKPKKSQYLKVARDFRGDRQFDKALYYYRKVLNDPSRKDKERWRAYRGARITYKLERWSRMEKYILASKQWSQFLKRKFKKSKELTRLHHDANIEYIRTLWTERGQNKAMPVLTQLEKDMKGRYSLQLVYWLKGRMAEEKGNHKEAVKWLKAASEEKTITQRDQQRVMWFLAWNQRRIGEFAQSQQTLEKVKKNPEMTFFAKTKYLYWQAENLFSMGKKEDAKDAFQRLADLDLYGYYGALAYRRLNKPFPEAPRPKDRSKEIEEFFKPNDRPFFRALVAVGETEVAEEFTHSKVKSNSKWDTENWVNYFSLLQTAGAFKTFFYRYHTLPPKKQLAILEEHPYLLFPQPYKEQVLKSAEKTQVSSALIYSIMKQESGFDAKARSHADAFGLLQLIPQVAKKAASRMPSVSYNDPYDLFKPHVIIPLGANNLHDLFLKFDSNFILSVASYNASERAVRGWVKTRFKGDPITFIEDIPYEETKGYVKLVMRNYIAYNRFDSKNEEFRFPEVCLEGLQSFKK